MKKMLPIIGILFLIAGVLFLLYALLNLFGYRHVLDGSRELYARLHQRMITHSIIGIILTVIGTVCMIARTKM